MELRQLRTFLAVVRERTVTEAAIALGLAPSSVSQQIRVLEESLGVPLFVRKPGGMELTDAGSRLLGWAPRLLDDAESARRAVLGQHRPLRFCVPETLIAIQVPAVLARLRDQRPDLGVDVTRAGTRDGLLADIVTGDVDAGLILDADGPIGSLGLTPVVGSEVLSFVDVEPVRGLLVARPGHPLAERPQLTRSDVRGHRLIIGPLCCAFHRAADHFFGTQSADRVEVPSVFIARSWAAQGLGIAFLPRFVVAPDLESGALITLNLTDIPPQAYLRLVWRADREAEPDLRDLLYAASAAPAESTR